jgi:hypothetical protein
MRQHEHSQPHSDAAPPKNIKGARQVLDKRGDDRPGGASKADQAERLALDTGLKDLGHVYIEDGPERAQQEPHGQESDQLADMGAPQERDQEAGGPAGQHAEDRVVAQREHVDQQLGGYVAEQLAGADEDLGQVDVRPEVF